MPYVGIPPGQHQRLTVKPAEYLLTIENYTSFVRYCREANGDRKGVIIFTGGFPARSVMRAIVELAGRLGAPTYHWGDIDPGGLRIFVHLEDAPRQADVRLHPHKTAMRIGFPEIDAFTEPIVGISADFEELAVENLFSRFGRTSVIAEHE